MDIAGVVIVPEVYTIFKKLLSAFHDDTEALPSLAIRCFLDAGSRLVTASIRYEKSPGLLSDLEDAIAAQNAFTSAHWILSCEMDQFNEPRILEFLDRIEKIWMAEMATLRGQDHDELPCDIPPPPCFINLSKTSFTSEEQDLLNKGPKFVPSSTGRFLKKNLEPEITKALRKTERLLDIYHFFAEDCAPRKPFETLGAAMERDQKERGLHPDSLKIFTKADWRVPEGCKHPQRNEFSRDVKQNLLLQRTKEINKSSNRRANYPRASVCSVHNKLQSTSLCALLKVDGCNQFVALELWAAFDILRSKLQACTKEVSAAGLGMLFMVIASHGLSVDH